MDTATVSTSLADLVATAAQKARQTADDFPDSVTDGDLPWNVIEAFDADVRGHVERERRIEDERDRVLITAVKLADVARTAEAQEVAKARRHLVDAIDYLEQAVLRFGVVNRKAAGLGYGAAGDPVSTQR